MIKRCADFSLKMHQKTLGPGSARSPNHLAGFKGYVGDKAREREGKRPEGGSRFDGRGRGGKDWRR